MGRAHPRHLPRSRIHEKTGMLSYHAMPWPQRGHLERGRTTDSSFGSRTMHTLRKLPSTSTKTPAMMAISRSGVTKRLVEQDPGRDPDVERLRARRQWNRHPPCRDPLALRAQAGAFVADDEGDGRWA